MLVFSELHDTRKEKGMATVGKHRASEALTRALHDTRKEKGMATDFCYCFCQTHYASLHDTRKEKGMATPTSNVYNTRSYVLHDTRKEKGMATDAVTRILLPAAKVARHPKREGYGNCLATI